MMSLYRSALAAFGMAGLLAIEATAQQPVQTALPEQLFAPVGTVLTVQVRDHLSSNTNSAGDEFLGMLQQPLVIDGWVVARPGQTVIGRVVSANSAGRVRGTSNLSIELTEMVLVDGHQAPIRTQLLNNYGRQSHGEDAATIAGGTVLGTIIGAAVGEGKGALIGAGVGAAAATAGVLSTRGKATEIYPESTLTFRLDAPLTVSTVRSQQAFFPVTPEDYENAPALRTPSRRDRPEAVADYGRYPRFPGSRGPRVGIIPRVILIPSIIIDHRGHRRRR